MITGAFDSGNSDCKTPLTVFPAGLVRHGTTMPLENSKTGQSEVLYYKGEYYSLSSIRAPYRYDKTEDDYYQVLALYGLAKNILASVLPQPAYKYDIALSLGLPPMHMNDLKEKYMEHFRYGGQPVQFAYNGIPFELKVKRVFVWMQGYAAIVPDFSELAKYPNVVIVDIGGFTTEVMLLNRGVIEQRVIDTFDDVGVIHFYNNIIKVVKNQLKITLHDATIRSILDGSYPMDKDPAMMEVAPIIMRLKDEYASDLVRLFRDKQIDLMASYPVFIGGGAQLFKDSLRKALGKKKAKFINDTKANAIGYQRLCNAARQEGAG